RLERAREPVRLGLAGMVIVRRRRGREDGRLRAALPAPRRRPVPVPVRRCHRHLAGTGVSAGGAPISSRVDRRSVTLPAARDLMIGRGDGRDVTATNAYVSRLHARGRSADGGWHIESVSDRGPYLDGLPVTTALIPTATTITLGTPGLGAN